MAKVDLSKAIAKINALSNVLHRPLRDTLDMMGRVVATNCARAAQPFGTGADAKAAGEKAVARDISKVYATPGKAFESLPSNRRGAFWSAYKKGQIDRAQSILDKYGSSLRGAKLQPFDGGAAHKSARNKTNGRVPDSQKPTIIVTNPKALAKYVAEEQSHVGTGKGGFADIVRAIGGTPRGLREEGGITANWITRRAHGYGAAFHGGTDENPELTIQNRVPYADQILNGTALNEAKRIGRERAIKNLEFAVRAETKKLRSAA